MYRYNKYNNNIDETNMRYSAIAKNDKPILYISFTEKHLFEKTAISQYFSEISIFS